MKLKLAAVGLLAAGSAIAADSNTLTVNAEVQGTCKFTTALSSVTIANSGAVIDPSSNTDATGQTTVQYKCTRGTTPVTTAGVGLYPSGGSHRVRHTVTNTEFIPYALVLSGGSTVGTGHGTGTEKTLTIDTTITAANHQNALAGNYQDTVVLSINP